MRVLARLAEMECEGVRIDVKKIEMSVNHFLEDADALKKLILQDAGCEFDLDSRKETLDALRKAEALREWITSRSLTQSEMEQLAWRHRLIEQIVKYRRVRKRLRELEAIRNAARRGRVFPLFSQLRVPHMSASSSSPNLDEALRADAVKDALLSQDYPNAKQAVRKLQQMTKDETLRTELNRCARPDFRCHGEPLLEGMEHGDVLLCIAIGLPNARWAAVSLSVLKRPSGLGQIYSVCQLQQPFSCRHDGASGSAGTIQQVILPAETS